MYFNMAGTLFCSLLSCARYTHYRFGMHSICKLALRAQTLQIALLPVGRQVGTFFLIEWDTQSCSNSRLRQHELSFRTFILAEWVTQKCSKSRFAKSSSGHYGHGSDQTVFNSLILLFNNVIHQKKSGNSRVSFVP